MHSDAGPSAADAVVNDTQHSRQAYLRCQYLDSGLLQYVWGLIKAGLVAAPAK